MFARKVCYFFVRPKRAFLELTIFLARPLRAPQIRRVRQSSRTKYTHVVHLRHRDECEAPLTDWLREAYHLEDAPAPARASAPRPRKKVARTKAAGKKTTRKAASTRRRARR
jgi:hypothetical protein